LAVEIATDLVPMGASAVITPSVLLLHMDTNAARPFKYTSFMAREGETIYIEHAYRVLDVPRDASSRAIKASYRRLIKRWHPDRYRPGSEAYSESTLMTRLLNESYHRIKNAPLRSGLADAHSSEVSPCSDRNTSGEPCPSGSSRSEYVPLDPNQDVAEYHRMLERARQAGARDDAARPFDWVGFSVRFILGALFGAIVSFRVMIDLWQESPRLIYTGIVATILLCGSASGFGGDTFWRSIRPGRLWWWRRWD
jgi:DnaJ domain